MMNREIAQKPAKKAPIVPNVILQPSKPIKIVVRAPNDEAREEMMWKIAKAEVFLFYGK